MNESQENFKNFKKMYLFQYNVKLIIEHFAHYSISQMGLTTAQCRLTNPQFQNHKFIERCKICGRTLKISDNKKFLTGLVSDKCLARN